jgi:hypothetical protein
MQNVQCLAGLSCKREFYAFLFPPAYRKSTVRWCSSDLYEIFHTSITARLTREPLREIQAAGLKFSGFALHEFDGILEVPRFAPTLVVGPVVMTSSRPEVAALEPRVMSCWLGWDSFSSESSPPSWAMRCNAVKIAAPRHLGRSLTGPFNSIPLHASTSIGATTRT